jgi:hypothetical protein
MNHIKKNILSRPDDFFRSSWAVQLNSFFCLVLSLIIFTFIMGSKSYASSPHSSGSRGEAEDIQLKIKTEYSIGWTETLGSYIPLQLIITNYGRARNIGINIRVGNNYRSNRNQVIANRNLMVGQGKMTIEIPVTRSAYWSKIDIHFEVDHRYAPDLNLHGPTIRSGGSYNNFEFIIAGKGFTTISKTLLTDQKDENTPKPGSPSATEIIEPSITSVSAEQLCYNWQSYLGLLGMVVLDINSLNDLTPSQATALSRWVMYGGGMIWLHGPDIPKQGKDTLYLPLNNPEKLHGLSFFSSITGNVILSSSLDLTKVSQSLIKTISNKSNKIRQLYNINQSADYSSKLTMPKDIKANLTALFNDLHNIPKAGFIIISIIMAIIIGPVNLFILKRRKKQVFFYLTAPVLACIGMFFLVIISIVMEGLKVKTNEEKILLHRLDHQQGAYYHYQGIFATLAPRKGLVFPLETAIIPFREKDNDLSNMSIETDWTSAQVLSRGWLKSREKCGIFSVTPARIRMGLKIIRNNNKIMLRNELTSQAETAIVRIKDQETGIIRKYQTGKIDPGQTVNMTPVNHKKIFKLPLLIGDLDWTILAELKTLPELHNKNINAQRLSEKYYYIGVTDSNTVRMQ